MKNKQKNSNSAVLQYASVMEEVKSRLFLIGEFIDNRTTTGSDTTDIEFVCLQLRKIMELIALASIVPNKIKYKEIRKNFHKHYHANRIFNDLEKVNVNFYPIPIIREDSNEPRVRHHIIENTDVWLTRKHFENEYDKLGGLLHADNPFKQRRAYVGLYQKYKTLTTNIWKLVEQHKISLIGGDIFWLIFMGNKSQQVRVFNIEKVN